MATVWNVFPRRVLKRFLVKPKGGHHANFKIVGQNGARRARGGGPGAGGNTGDGRGQVSQQAHHHPGGVCRGWRHGHRRQAPGRLHVEGPGRARGGAQRAGSRGQERHHHPEPVQARRLHHRRRRLSRAGRQSGRAGVGPRPADLHLDRAPSVQSVLYAVNQSGRQRHTGRRSSR
jgi:hypothetical protein